MYNPYVSSLSSALQPVSRGKDPLGGLGGLLGRLGSLDSDDLLLLLMIYLLIKDGEQDNIWPLAAALIYLML